MNLYPRVWWDNSGAPRLGEAVSPAQRRELFVHHTVAIDHDPTPLQWETDAEIIDYMRRLRTVRATDLGPDIPYNFVAFIRPNWSLTVVEGRGFHRSGAHTKYHNKTGVATSYAGDFHNYTITEPAILVSEMNAWHREQAALYPHLVRTVYGHRDMTGPTSPHPDVGWTACPGRHLYALKPEWSWLPALDPEEDDQEDDMEVLLHSERDKVWYLFTTGKDQVTGLPGQESEGWLKALMAKGVKQVAMSDDLIDDIPFLDPARFK